nr:MAG TPA: hypothetical protein [Caudoviricetes sp.]
MRKYGAQSMKVNSRNIEEYSRGEMIPMDLFVEVLKAKKTFEDEGYTVYGYSDEYDDHPAEEESDNYEVKLGEEVTYQITKYGYYSGWYAGLCIKGVDEVYHYNAVHEIPAGVARSIITFINTDQEMEVRR